ncbi:MAG: pitrilysin family protein [Rikenellaceae bacterium]
MEFFTYTLPNGMRGIHRQTRSGVAYCALLVNAGTRDEREGEFGLAHFTEHGLFKGTKRRRAYHINCRLENLGGELNAFTTKEDTTVHATTLRADISKAAELIADVVFNSTFPQKEMSMERDVIYDEINSYKDSPSELIWDTFEEMLFEGSELGHNILGIKRDIKRFTGDSIRQFMERTYTCDEMVFSSIGNITPKRIVEIATRYIGGVETPRRSFVREQSKCVAPFNKLQNKQTHQAHCVLGGGAYSIADKRRLPLSLLVNILGGASANSRLNMVVREKYGLTYNIEASYTPNIDTGVFGVYFSSEKGNTDQALELINTELERLMREPLTVRQLSMAKRQFIAQATIAQESSEGYMLGAGKSLLVHGEIDSMQEMCRRVSQLTADDIQSVASDIFKERSVLIYK